MSPLFRCRAETQAVSTHLKATAADADATKAELSPFQFEFAVFEPALTVKGGERFTVKCCDSDVCQTSVSKGI